MRIKPTFRVILPLVMVFALSLVVRYPNLNRPLSKHHEFVTAIPLRVLKIWQKEGASKYHFNPVMNYSGAANKNINVYASTTGDMKDSEGNYYYVSHPQLAYILPYFIFKVTGVKAEVGALQSLNLVGNFFSAFLIYLIICLLCRKKPFEQLFVPGLVAYVIYIFASGVLWFQSNTYMSDILVQLPFIWSTFIVLTMVVKNKTDSIKHLLLYAISLFIMIYTSWLGLFFAFSVALFSIANGRKDNRYLLLLGTSTLIVISSLGLIIWQYSLINGAEAYFNQMLHRFSVRGNLSGETNFWSEKISELGAILFAYTTSYLPIFLLLITFLTLFVKNNKIASLKNKGLSSFCWLSIAPIVLLHLVLMNYSGHDFVSLYAGLFLSVMVGVLYNQLKNSKSVSISFLNRLTFFTVIFSVGIYFFINRPGQYSLNGDYYATSYEIGKFIKKEAQPDEIIYLTGNVVLDPQLIVYAERNIIPIEIGEIKEKLNIHQSVCFVVKSRKQIEVIR